MYCGPSVDFESAHAAALEGLPDPDVLAIAAKQGRILVSHDYRTMPRHFRNFRDRHHSSGVFLISQDIPIGRAVEALLLIWSASEAHEWENQLTYLPL